METQMSLVQRGEAAAARFIEHNGYQILENCKRYPADIVAERAGRLALVRVVVRQGRSTLAPMIDETVYEQLVEIAQDITGEANPDFEYDCIKVTVLEEDKAYLQAIWDVFGSTTAAA